jgi:hypothetical protein
MLGNYCWWSIGDGIHGKMLRSTVRSMKEHNIEGDIHLWTDQTNIDGATIHPVVTNSFDKKHYLFKFRFLKDQVAKLPYDYFIFFDADSYFVRPLPYDPLIMMQGSPVHSFLESYTSHPKNIRFDWWGCWLTKYEELMREKGVMSRRIYNVNAGLWIVQKEAIGDFYHLSDYFWKYCHKLGVTFTEEAPLAYTTHMLCGDAEAHTLINFTDFWASDWTGNFNNILPTDREWFFEDYFTTEKIPVNPAIVHCMRSKNALAAN